MSLRHALLGALAVRPSSGYELVTRFSTTLKYVWSASPGAIYAEVNRLETDGLVEAAEQGPRGRTTYAVTEAGLAEMRRWLLTPPRQPRAESVLRTYALWLLDDEQALAYLGTLADDYRARLAEFRSIREDVDLDDRQMFFSQLALGAGIAGERSRLGWVEWATEAIAARRAQGEPRSAPADG